VGGEKTVNKLKEGSLPLYTRGSCRATIDGGRASCVNDPKSERNTSQLPRHLC